MSVKEINLKEHGNFIYGTLDGVDFVPSGVIRENNQAYSASVKLKFIMKSTVVKEINGTQIPTIRANSQIIKIECKDEELPALALKYNDLVGKDLLINYGGRDGDTFKLQNEKDIINIK
ncbi:hypothetical protein CP965_01965 [Halarcobacter mediterraneus]|uniref:Uncharacterized protein n=1 Tax=Halarcobacter mediterraneus TaxID=2023153 RepID=A0A4Q1B552_9BACT|nr:hypothetical protein [Halarcobacter mediterraneus]RXK14237.1 hypothetical protein CP965_01965 [Halarcobacter mediterraneus]